MIALLGDLERTPEVRIAADPLAFALDASPEDDGVGLGYVDLAHRGSLAIVSQSARERNLTRCL